MLHKTEFLGRTAWPARVHLPLWPTPSSLSLSFAPAFGGQPGLTSPGSVGSTGGRAAVPLHSRCSHWQAPDVSTHAHPVQDGGGYELYFVFIHDEWGMGCCPFFVPPHPVRKNEICGRENLIGPFLVQKLLGPTTPPPLLLLLFSLPLVCICLFFNEVTPPSSFLILACL